MCRSWHALSCLENPKPSPCYSVVPDRIQTFGMSQRACQRWKCLHKQHFLSHTQKMISSTLARTTPKSSKSQHRLQDLLRAAQTVFTQHGYQRTTMAQIAETAGVSEATVFTYFASKRELCIQVITRWYDEISSELERDVPALPGVHAKLSHVVRAHLVTLLADGSGMCALVLGEGRAAGPAEPELAEVIAACKRRYTTPLMDALAVAQAQGQVRADMPLRLLRELVYGSMEHVLWDAITSAKRPDIDTTAAQLTELIWSALVPREAALASLAALGRFRDEVHDALHRASPLPSKPPLQA
jgi:AcrR family transcriptional regulator